jgi:tetratricopeptide (TPR) repeat protein
MKMKKNSRYALAVVTAVLLAVFLTVSACKDTKPAPAKKTATTQPPAPPPPAAAAAMEAPASEPEETPDSKRASPNPFETIDQALAAAKELSGKKQIDKAIDIYLLASGMDETDARPHVEIAALMIPRREAAGARLHAQKAVELKPEWSRAWNTLGRVELLDGALDRAAEAFSEATKHNADNIFAWNNLGLVRIKQGEWTLAVEALKRATSGKGVRGYMFNNLGIALERLDEVDDALVAYREGLARGSGVAGQNFVRLEKELDLDETARSDHPDPADEPSES